MKTASRILGSAAFHAGWVVQDSKDGYKLVKI